MGLEGMFALLEGHPAYRRLVREVTSRLKAVPLEAPESARPYLISAIWHHTEAPVLAIVPQPEDARRLHDQLLTYLGEDAPVHLFPEPEVLPFERLVADVATNNQRMLALAAFARAGDGALAAAGENIRAPLVVASTPAALRRTLLPETLKGAWHTLQVGARVRLADLLSRWVALGYQREAGVEVPGTFSHRGGIVDVYPPSSQLPARIELVGDEIESIRLFDPASQRSVGLVDSVTIIPASELLPSLADEDRISRLIARMDLSHCSPAARRRFQEELDGLFSLQVSEELPLYNGLINQGCLIDHLPQRGLLILDREGEIESTALDLGDRTEELRAARERRGELPANFPSPQLTWDEFRSSLETRPRLLVKGWTGKGGFEFLTAPSYYGRLPQLGADIRDMLREGRRVVVISQHARRLSELLAEAEVGATVRSGLDSPPQPGSLSLLSGILREGWHLPLDGAGLTLLTDAEIFGTAKVRRPRARTPVKRGNFLSDLLPGEYVVHVDHGVARFTGAVHMESDGESKEYLALEYAQGDMLYLPTEHLDRVSPYMAPHDRPPSLTRLGTPEWSRVKERVKHSAQELAQELLELYAERQLAQGHAFSPDSPWQQELEDSFPYEETADQGRTIREVKEEMERERPMDRLVCGDVGYGKTEVALRAAFKAVTDGMQVAILVPTTVLAQQHYATFTERLSPFPVKVEVLSRFRTRKEQSDVTEGLKLGTVDIAIGTHRLLQKDVKFKDLGLVVVDEEQRFGVAHKERLTQMRRQVDILALSATPIPRTLYMGLSGIRDMSTMETPPEERLPVKTYVSEYSDDVVKEAILREIERGGQVFFLHNRVQTIGRVADDLRRLVPQARIAIGHGRMREADLEKVMIAFAQGEANVLVCTTIIESGLDIPNANTLIIDRADRFGLSQLYQLRGRVGRGGYRAHTYLLIPPRRRITEAAGRRLKAILEASELGAGFRIAMRDLEIRGAGNILGPEQSGHIHAVGFDLYSQLLNQAVAEIKSSRDGSTPPAAVPTSQARVTLKLSAYIPEDYITHLPNRLAVYQRFTRVRDRQEVEDMADELRDRFGPLPQVVDNLLYLVRLKLLAGEAGIESATQSGVTITLALLEPVGGARVPLEKALGPLASVGHQQIHVKVSRTDDHWRHVLLEVVEKLKAFREHLSSAVIPQ